MQPLHELQSEERPVPLRRVIAWIAIGLLIAAGTALFFRYAPGLNPLLG